MGMQSVDQRDFRGILRVRWRLIAATTLLAVLTAGIASMLATPLYESTASVFVNTTDAERSVGSGDTASQFTRQRVASYVDVVTATPVAQAVVDQLGLAMTPQALVRRISVTNPPDTVILEISATDPRPELAQQIANTTADQFAARVSELERPLEGGEALVRIETIQEAPLPTSPVSPRTALLLALGLLGGLAIGLAAALLLERSDTRITSVEALRKGVDIPLLGVIGLDSDAAEDALIAHGALHSELAESFRKLRTNLQFVGIDHPPRSLVLTSALPEEGKTTTAINLAITLAQAGQPVFLVEGDLRHPRVADCLGVESGAGLTDVLVGRATVDEVLQPWGKGGNLWVLAAGLLPPNPSELLGSQAMADLLHHLETRATLIIDAPPLLPVTDAAVITRLAGGAIVVLAANKTRREHLRAAVSSIDSVGGRILGLVMTMAPKRAEAHRHVSRHGYEHSGSATGGRATAVPGGPGRRHGVSGPATPAGTVTRTQVGGQPVSGAEAVVREPATAAPGTATSRPPEPVPRAPEPVSSSVSAPLVRSSPTPPPSAAGARRDEPAVSPFDADTVLPGEVWQPPRPRPAFDPLTAPLEEVSRDA